MPSSIQRNLVAGTVCCTLPNAQHITQQGASTQQRCHTLLKFYNETLSFALHVRPHI